MRFSHYTGEKETVRKILKNGFAWVPNMRSLISDLLPLHDFTAREPQQFGMISFTELPPEAAQGPRRAFGNYGIVVSKEWAFSHSIQKVIYVANEGPIFEAIRWIFQYAYDDLVGRSMKREGEVTQMAFTNKARAAVAGGMLYAKLLEIYEYMEPIEHSYQQEWRMVHPMSLYGYGETKQEIIKNVSPPKGWAKFVHVLSITPNDVVGFVCPARERDIFQETLDRPYKGKHIYTYEG
jgi:hypothetical protein